MSLVRSRSTDIDTRMSSPLRPASRDRPSPRGMSTFDESQPRPGSSHLYTSNLNPIGEGIVQASSLNKKKRRSSLSDLKPVPGSRIAPPWSPLQPQLRRADATPERPQIPRALPRTPSPHKTTFEVHESKDPVPNSASPHRFGSPQRFGSTQRFGSPGKPPSPQRKENSPLVNRVASPKKASKPESENSPMAGFSPKKGVGSPSGLPTSKVGLSERPWPPNTKASAKKLPQPSQKLRIQSPQKVGDDDLVEQLGLRGHSFVNVSAMNKKPSARRKAASKPNWLRSAKSSLPSKSSRALPRRLHPRPRYRWHRPRLSPCLRNWPHSLPRCTG